MCLLINVASATDRLEEARAQLDQQGIDWERLDAVTPKSDEFAVPELSSKWYRGLTNGEVACYLSHKKAWRQAIDAGVDYLVVLEDDLIIDGPLKKIIDEVIEADLSWDMVKLFETRKQRRAVRSLDNGASIVDTPTMPIATTGYIVKVSSLPRLLESTKHFNRPIDIEFKSYWELNLRIYSVFPPPIKIAEENESTIGVRQGDLSTMQRLGKMKYNLLSSLRSRLGYIFRVFSKP
jgi:glycosyl transferase family 25